MIMMGWWNDDAVEPSMWMTEARMSMTGEDVVDWDQKYYDWSEHEMIEAWKWMIEARAWMIETNS